MDIPNNDPITVYFGGGVRELWTCDGLQIVWSGRLAVLARRGSDGRYIAAGSEPGRSGDLKSDCNTALKERELASLLNSGSAPPLTSAYFKAAARAAEALRLCGDDPRRLPEFLSAAVYGGFDSLLLPELLRVLLDDHSLSWEDAAALISQCFAFKAEKSERAPLNSVAALSPRVSRLSETIGDKLCKALWNIFPGDWERIASAAVISDGEVDFGKLCAALCGRIICSKEKRADEFRTLYVAMPDKFEEMI